ncbi:MAG: Txe/YoeB family addiction module toxin [Prolixibacteraceae bacterium]
MYRLTLSPEAEEDLDTFIKSGSKALLKKIFSLFEELKQHPYSGIGKPERLKYELSGKWSRRINSEHRIVYSVNEEVIEVYVFSMRHHYTKK